jgi:hypothetical protein
MADSKASALTAASALSGAELWAAVQGGADRKITASQILTYVMAAIVDAAPSTLDTLNELAAALGDDPNFATTVTTALAGKQPLDSDLTAVAALATTSYGRAFLELADAAAARTAIGLASGTYTPTLTNGANVAASTAYQCMYMRINDMVTVAGRVDIDPTSASASTIVGMSLPIASDFSTTDQCAGAANAPNALSLLAAIVSDPTNNRAQVQYLAPTNVGNNALYFTFMYQVI